MGIKDLRKQKNIKEEFKDTEEYLRELFKEAKEIVEKAGFEVIERGEIDSIIEKMFDDTDKFKQIRVKLLDEKNIYILTEDEIKTIETEITKKFQEKNDNDEDDIKKEKEKCASKKEFLEKLITGVNYIDLKEDKNENKKINLENLIK